MTDWASDPACVLIVGRYGGVTDTLAAMLRDAGCACRIQTWGLDGGGGAPEGPSPEVVVVTVAPQDEALVRIGDDHPQSAIVGVTWHPVEERPDAERVQAWVRAGELRRRLHLTVAAFHCCTPDQPDR